MSVLSTLAVRIILGERGDFLEICAYFEEIAYDSPDFKVITCSTNDESASRVPQRNLFAKKEKYAFKVVFKKIDVNLNFDKSRQYVFFGDWKERSSGISFESYGFEINVKKNKSDIIAYLSGFEGIGKKTAEAVYDAFGPKTMDILEKDIKKLSELKINKSKIEKLVTGYEKNKCRKKTMDFFLKFSLPINKIDEIYNKYKEDAIKTMQINPFEFSESGCLSFLETNAAAVKQGIELNSGDRQKQGLIYIMETCFRPKGDLFFFIPDVLALTQKFLNSGVSEENKVTEDVLRKRLVELNKTKVYLIKDYVYLINDLFAEKKSADALVDFINYEGNLFKLDRDECYKEISEIEKEIEFKLNEAQKRAVYTAISSNVSIITGGPGTGKTTLLKFIIRIFQRNFSNNIKLCSPTGKAARRMAESTGMSSASTVHSLLGITANHKWTRELTGIKEVNADLLVIDEASMIDMELMYLLVSSISFRCKLVFLGDVDQLPSVGPGDVLCGMIKSNLIPTTILDKIYRQSEQSNIVKNAFSFNKGDYKKLIYDEGKSVNDSFVIVPRKSNIDEQIADIFCNSVKRAGSIDEVQVLTPYRKTGVVASTVNINKIIQEKINPKNRDKKEIHYLNQVFRVGDRVIQQKNTENAKNGDIGTIIDIESGDIGPITATIDFGDENIVIYGFDEIIENKIELAYALTVHKSQGSEYKTVIMPCIPEHELMLTRKLVYTAWTRAKEHIILIGDKETVNKASLKIGARTRNTRFSERISVAERKYKKEK